MGKVQQAVDQGSKHYIITEPWNQYLADLNNLDALQPGLLAWHVLPWLRPLLNDVGGLVKSDRVVCNFFDRAVHLMDYSPLVWALGLDQPVAPATSSPLPPPPGPPLPASVQHKLLIRTAKQLTEITPRVGSLHQHVSCLQEVVQQAQQQRPAALGCTRLLPELWRLHNKAQALGTFWQLVGTCPALQPGACGMAGWIAAAEVAPAAEALLQSGLLPQATTGDIWWWVARLDNATGDRARVLELFGTLALQAPHHPALDCLAALLLQYARNDQQQVTHNPRGAFLQQPKQMASWGQEISKWSEPSTAQVLQEQFLPAFTCHMSSAEVVGWVSRLQLVLPPQQTCSLLLQLLQDPANPRALLKHDLLQLYDLLLQQVARTGWEAQQQKAVLAPAAADVVLSLLPKTSTSRSAAAKVLVVWRHMTGALDPAWCGGGLAAAAKAVGEACKQAPTVQHRQQQQQEEKGEDGQGAAGGEGGARSSCLPSLAVGSGLAASKGRQQLQQLSAKGKQQVEAALEKLGLQAELREVRAVVGA